MPQPLEWQGAVHTPNSDRSLATTRSPLNRDGTLTAINVLMTSSTKPIVGQCYVRVVLENSSQQEETTLCRGYIYRGHEIYGGGGMPYKTGDNIRVETYCSIAGVLLQPRGLIQPDVWVPGGWSGTDKGSLEGPGALYGYDGSNPAAGANGLETVPTGARLRLRGIQQSLVTSATSATRKIRFTGDISAYGEYIHQTAGITQAASLTRVYIACAGGDTETAANASGQVSVKLPSDVWLSAGDRIQILIEAIGLADNLGAPAIKVE